MNTHILKSKTKHWGIGWMLAFVGFPLGGLLASLIAGRMETPASAMLGGLIAGGLIGSLQWLALRRAFTLSTSWIILTSAGLALGLGLSVALFGASTEPSALVLRALPTGLVVGFSQALGLHSLGRRAWLWPLLMAVLWPVAWFVTSGVIGASVDNAFFVFGASGALVYQGATGLLLWRILPR